MANNIRLEVSTLRVDPDEFRSSLAYCPPPLPQYWGRLNTAQAPRQDDFLTFGQNNARVRGRVTSVEQIFDDAGDLDYVKIVVQLHPY